MNTLLSFVVPCYNSEKTIGRTLDSIFAQDTDFCYEVIVVDNGSRDNTLDIISKFPNVRLFSEQLKGANHARNMGLKNANGEFIAFVDSDVVLDQKWSKELLSYIQDKCLLAAQGKVVRAPLNNKDAFLERYRCSQVDHPTNWLNLITKNYKLGQINTAACIYKTSTLRQVKGFSKVLKIHEDSDLTYKLRSLPYTAIGCTRSAVSFCYYTGGLFGILKKSIVSGYYAALLVSKWSLVRTRSESNEFIAKQFWIFHSFLGLLSKLGEYFGHLVLALNYPVELKREAQWIRKISLLPKDPNCCAYFENQKINIITE